MNALMNPMLPVKAAQSPANPKVVKDPENGSSFYEYVEKKVGSERQQEKNYLGVEEKPKNSLDQQTNGTSKASAKASDDMDKPEDASVAELLGLLMLEIKKVSEDIEAGPGAWSLNMSDQELLQQLAAHAGMSEERLAALLQQMESQGGKIDLNELLAALARHFEELKEGKPIAVPETDLPLLESFLNKMGVPITEIENISQEAVRGDNTLDLLKFLQGLESLDSEQAITLSDWEAEQLQDILAKAGVSDALQRELLPERNPSWMNPAAQNRAVQLSLSRLQDMLAKGLQEVQDNQLKADVPGFLKDLESLLAQTGFEEESAGWSPVVQQSVTSIYEKLMESIDMSEVKVEAPEENMQAMAGQELEDDLDGFLGEDAETKSGLKGDAEMLTDSDLAEPVELVETPTSQQTAGEQANLRAPENTLAQNMQASGSEAMAADDVEAPPPPPRMPQGVQQQTFETLTQSVIRGLKNNEHHLVLKLYPKELGEVKVEMLVRDEQVAVSFSMENAKVKDIMEKNMDQFRENLEKQGFVLEECLVSDGQDDADDAWRQFEFAWKQQQQTGKVLKRESLADLPENVLYHRPQTNNGSEKGIDLFA